MKSADQIISELNATLDIYEHGLSQYNESTFTFKVDEDTWSLAQMYEHVFSSAKKFFLANTKRCIEKRNGQEGGEKNARGEALIAAGAFPPIKIKVPESVKVEIVPQSIEAYKEDIAIVRASAQGLLDGVNKDKGTYKIGHPVFGFLNAHEWFLQLEMHSSHHLRQKAELESLASNG